MAARYHHVALCTALLELGADINAKAEVRATARQPAAAVHARRPFRFRRRAHALLCRAAAGALTRPCRRWSRCSGRAQGDWTPMHCAARFGNEAVCTLLCERGADVKAKGTLYSVVRATARQPVPPPRLGRP